VRLVSLTSRNHVRALVCTVRILEAGAAGVQRRDVGMARFMGLCQAGYSQSGAAPAPSDLVPSIAAGALFELIRTHTTDDRLDQLPEALPTAVLIVLAPILGRDEALALAASPTA
jgi:hypothetical protein